MNEPAAQDKGLIFPWKNSPTSIWRLLPPLLLCLIVLTAVTLVFKVAPPPSSRNVQGSRSLLLLNPDHPMNQSALNRALDHGALLLARPEALEDAGEEALLPLFKPSFAGFEPRLKEPVASPADTPRYRLFQPHDLALPPLPAPRLTAGPSAPPPAFHLQPVFHGALANLPLRMPPALNHLRPHDLARMRFEMGVLASGQTLIASPLTSGQEDRDLVPALQAALNQTRFAPHAGPEVKWGEVSFIWKRAPDSNPP